MKYFIDSSAWIEYFEGSSLGRDVFDILKKEDVYSFSIIVSEVISKVKRNNKDFNLAFKVISSNSKILDITPEIAKEAGIFHAEMKKKQKDFGLIDSIIWVIAKKLDAKLVTCDFHFKDFKNVLLLK